MGCDVHCYFLKNGVVYGVEYLKAEADEALIEQGIKALKERSRQGFDAVEVWRGKRLLGRFRLDQVSH